MYFNDILIYLKTGNKHKRYINQVLQTLQDIYLQVKLEKSTFYIHKIKYLGYIISNKGIKIDPEEIRAINKLLTLKNISKVLFFLGFINFYYRFIKEYSKVALNLISLIKKNAKWV